MRRPAHIEVDVTASPWIIFHCRCCLRARPYVAETSDDLAKWRYDEALEKFYAEHAKCGRSAA